MEHNRQIKNAEGGLIMDKQESLEAVHTHTHTHTHVALKKK